MAPAVVEHPEAWTRPRRSRAVSILSHPRFSSAPLSPDRLRFTVGMYVFEAVLVTQKPFDQDGKEVNAVIDYEDQRIEVWADLSRPRMVRALYHELLHAWTWAYPPPLGNEEALCDWMAHFAYWANDSLLEQGGLDALSSLTPIERSVL